MAGQIHLICLLAVVALVHGGEFNIDHFFSGEKNTIDEEKTVILDEKIDALLPSIREFILKNGLDPTNIANYSEQFLPGIVIDLKKGQLQNLSTVKRTKHVIGIYKDKHLKLEMDLGFDVLDCSYEYGLSLKYLFYKRRGDVFARFYNLDINVVLTIDLVNYNITLGSIEFSDVRKYDIKFEGHLLDRILNALSKVVTTVFRHPVLTEIEKRSMKIFNEKIDEWNKLIPRPNSTTVIKDFINFLNEDLL